MFLVGLDNVGDMILEINVFTPGGPVGLVADVRDGFVESVIIALESKVAIRAAYPSSVGNRQLATL